MRKLYPYLAAIWMIALSCRGDVTPVSSGSPQEEQVLANLATVQDAVASFAAANSGETPADVASDTTGDGRTLIDFLPGGERLENPFTGELTEPRDGAASTPGEIGYVPTPLGGVQVIYTLNAWGETDEIAVESNVDDLEATAIANAMLVRDAADAFAAESGGEYPSDVSADTTPLGNTLRDFLPDGQRLVNPFVLAFTEPVDGMAANPGEVGYVPLRSGGGSTTGYVITVRGLQEDILSLTSE